MSKYTVKVMYLKKPKRLIIWNGGSSTYIAIIYVVVWYINSLQHESNRLILFLVIEVKKFVLKKTQEV
jgi:hypothetical protein